MRPERTRQGRNNANLWKPRCFLVPNPQLNTPLRNAHVNTQARTQYLSYLPAIPPCYSTNSPSFMLSCLTSLLISTLFYLPAMFPSYSTHPPSHLYVILPQSPVYLYLPKECLRLPDIPFIYSSTCVSTYFYVKRAPTTPYLLVILPQLPIYLYLPNEYLLLPDISFTFSSTYVSTYHHIYLLSYLTYQSTFIYPMNHLPLPDILFTYLPTFASTDLPVLLPPSLRTIPDIYQHIYLLPYLT